MCAEMRFQLNLLFDTRVWTAVKEAYSGSSESVQPIKSLSSNRYRGHRCTMVNSQSRNLSFPHLGSASCAEMNVAKAELLRTSPAYDANASENELTKGVYRER